MTNNSSNQKFTNNADGFDLTGGTTARKLTLSGGDAYIVGSGTAVITLPSVTSTLYGTGTGSITSAQILASLSDETGTGSLVFATSPTLVTPTLGVASATSVNKVAITAPATGSTLTIADGKTLTASNTLTFTGTDASSVAFGTGGTVLYSGGALGTPSSATLTNATGLPVAGITASTVTALGVGSLELGHATDTTLSRVSAGVAAIEGSNIMTVGSTDTITGAKSFGSGNMKLNGATSGTLTVNAGATTTSHTLTMPSAQGAALTVLTNDGAGNLSWAAASVVTNISSTYVAAMPITSGYGVTGPDASGNVYQGVSPTTYATGQYSSVVNGNRESFGWIDATHFVVAYQVGSPYANYVVAGIVNSDGTISYGTPVQLTTSAGSGPIVRVLDTTHIIVGFGTGTTAYFTALTLSGTTLTAGTETTKTGLGTIYEGDIFYHEIIAINASTFIAFLQDINKQTNIIVGTVSGTTITLGNVYQSSATSFNGILKALMLDSTHFVVGFKTGFWALTVSGTVVTIGTLTAGTDRPNGLAKLDSTHFVQVGESNGIQVASVSGTTITWGTNVTTTTSPTSNTLMVSAIDSTHFIAFYQATNIKAVAGSVSGTTITLGTETIVDSNAGTIGAGNQASTYNGNGLASVSYIYSSVQYVTSVSINGTTITVIGTTNCGSNTATNYLYSYNNTPSTMSISPKIVQYTIIVPTSNFIGIAGSTVASGANLSVINSGTANSFTGLTIGTPYYYSTTGAYSTTSSSYRIGIAVTSTAIQINSNRNNTNQFF